MDFQYFIELFFGGLTRGSIYALIALGYTLVYGIIELINFAHGEIYMLGAFTALQTPARRPASVAPHFGHRHVHLPTELCAAGADL